MTPVVDYLATRADVDMSKLALIGNSFGGNLAPRAASGEHRFSAVISNDGLPSMQQAIAVRQLLLIQNIRLTTNPGFNSKGNC